MTIIIIFVKSDTFSSPYKVVMLYYAERAKLHKYRPQRAFFPENVGTSEVSACSSMLQSR